MRFGKSPGGAPQSVGLQWPTGLVLLFMLLTFVLMASRFEVPEGYLPVEVRIPVTCTGPFPFALKLSASPAGELERIELDGREVNSLDQLRDATIRLKRSFELKRSFYDSDDRANEIEILLDCDQHLKYVHLVHAITAFSGYIDQDGHIVKLIQKIEFSRPPEPARPPLE